MILQRKAAHMQARQDALADEMVQLEIMLGEVRTAELAVQAAQLPQAAEQQGHTPQEEEHSISLWHEQSPEDWMVAGGVLILEQERQLRLQQQQPSSQVAVSAASRSVQPRDMQWWSEIQIIDDQNRTSKPMMIGNRQPDDDWYQTNRVIKACREHFKEIPEIQSLLIRIQALPINNECPAVKTMIEFLSSYGYRTVSPRDWYRYIRATQNWGKLLVACWCAQRRPSAAVSGMADSESDCDECDSFDDTPFDPVLNPPMRNCPKCGRSWVTHSGRAMLNWRRLIRACRREGGEGKGCRWLNQLPEGNKRPRCDPQVRHHSPGRVAAYMLDGTQVCLAGLGEGADFGTFPRSWTIDMVLNSEHWISILRKPSSTDPPREHVHYERRPIGWRPMTVVHCNCINMMGRSHESIVGVPNEPLGLYYAAHLTLLTTPATIIVPQYCQPDPALLDDIPQPPTPPFVDEQYGRA